MIKVNIVGMEAGRLIECQEVLLDLRKATKMCRRYDLQLKKTNQFDYLVICNNGYDFSDVVYDMSGK